MVLNLKAIELIAKLVIELGTELILPLIKVCHGNDDDEQQQIDVTAVKQHVEKIKNG